MNIVLSILTIVGLLAVFAVIPLASLLFTPARELTTEELQDLRAEILDYLDDLEDRLLDLKELRDRRT